MYPKNIKKLVIFKLMSILATLKKSTGILFYIIITLEGIFH